MDVKQLYEFLEKTQEPKGYLFNKDKPRVFNLLEGLAGKQEQVRVYVLPVQAGLERPRLGPRYNLPLRLQGAGCCGVRELLLCSLCFKRVE